ncbi:MAG: TetR/AcrR family transcriptional regulator [Desulfosalsimonadaceae bacterium]
MKPPRNPAEIDALRERILNSALEIIAGVGMEGLTMRKLASKLHMTAPNLYNYFSSKDEIYISIVIRGFEMLHAAIKATHDQNTGSAVRIRAMIDAYMHFGMNHPQYYDIMFNRPTPKHEDYVGTPHEALSAVEYRISMEIAEMAIDTAASLFNDTADSEAVQRRVVEIWSLMHGMITLSHSRVVQYVINPAERVYETIIDEYVKKLLPE